MDLLEREDGAPGERTVWCFSSFNYVHSSCLAQASVRNEDKETQLAHLFEMQRQAMWEKAGVRSGRQCTGDPPLRSHSWLGAVATRARGALGVLAWRGHSAHGGRRHLRIWVGAALLRCGATVFLGTYYVPTALHVFSNFTKII